MTEYELASLNLDTLMLLGASFATYFSLVSAFLVASYLAAHRLTRTMTAILIGLFVLWSLLTVATMSAQLSSLSGLAKKMRAFAGEGKGLEWHRAANLPDAMIDWPRFMIVAILALAAIAAVYFFFHCRRVNRKAEAGA
jgi:hypothetical protein